MPFLKPLFAKAPERARDAAVTAAGWLLDFTLPPRCPLCDLRIAVHGALCAACWAQLPLIERPYCERLGTPFDRDHGPGFLSAAAIADPPVFGRARAATRYAGPAIDLVRRLKYGDRDDLAAVMGRLLARAAGDLVETVDVVVPIPLYRWRLWRRRFNQSALLAGALCRHTALRHAPELLERHRPTTPQVGLSRTGRARNVQGAFRVPEARQAEVMGLRVLLVDDVMTSGATCEAAARVLLRSGAASVDVVTFAVVVPES